MITGSNVDMLPSLDDHLQGPDGTLEDSLQSELELMLQAHRKQHMINQERDLNIYRSGSAPPTVEGSLSSMGSLFRNSNFSGINSISNICNNNVCLTEDEIRSHPAYLSYYYSHDNLNPRLPPPLLSKEDWRVAQRFQGGSFGGIGDLRKKLVDGGDSSSLFSMQPGISAPRVENDLMDLRIADGSNLCRNPSADWLDRGSDGLIGLQGAGLGARRKSFADILQEGLDQPASLSGNLSRPASHNAFVDIVGRTGTSDPHPAGLLNGVESLDSLQPEAAPHGWVGVQNHGTTISHSFASAVGSSLSRSTTTEQQLGGRSSISGLPPLGSRIGPIDKKNAVGVPVQNGHSSGMNEISEIAATLSGLNLSQIGNADPGSVVRDQFQQPDFLFKKSSGHNQIFPPHLVDKSNAENLSFATKHINVARENGVIPNLNASKISSNEEISIPKRTTSSVNLHSKMNSSDIGSLERSNVRPHNVDTPSSNFTGQVPSVYSLNQKLNSLIKNHLDGGSALGVNRIGHGSNGLENQFGPDIHFSVVDPHCVEYLQRTCDHAPDAGTCSSGPQVRNYFGSLHGDLDGIQKVYLEALLAQQKQEYELAILGKSGGMDQGYYMNPSDGLAMPYLGNSMTNPVFSSVGAGTFPDKQVAPFASVIRSTMGGCIGSWNSDIGRNDERRCGPSLLDEFKNNKTRSFELSDIVGHVVEFSMDQYGSRFIQQKLETATVEEKNKIFPEIIPHACTLMTDVFGNYVIQKFFEHGTESQRTELASQLTGHVLSLSLQMYGCRVIQKALEVVDVDQRTCMVVELDGSVMKCVCDQNGNHVIQKCIECVPEDRIQFIISAFYGQVVVLSTHPYGCRVIQRLLEHCNGTNTQEIIMDEIMQYVCTLAQDQYGNYVVQHVLEHGKPHERSAIIIKLAGQIVKMSQQKFASNVVEKCLTFGGTEERQLLVNEMLGSINENGALEVMMKDPFGNYVVQKLLETCNDKSLDLILARIRVHLNTLKRYTYGKHIVSRVEKLIAAGERRMGLLSSFTS